MKATDYIAGDRRGRAAHDLEAEALQDGFLAEALEGFEAVAGDHAAAVDALRRKIADGTQNRTPEQTPVVSRRRIWRYTAVAATLLLILVVGITTWRHPSANLPAGEQIVCAPKDSSDRETAQEPIAQILPPQPATTAPPKSAQAGTTTGENRVLPADAADDAAAAGQENQSAGAVRTPDSTMTTEPEQDWEPGMEAAADPSKSAPEETVVVAYGTRKQTTHTGAIGNPDEEYPMLAEQTVPSSQRSVSGRQEDTADQPFLTAETMPSFLGGDYTAFRRWVQARIRTPKTALSSGVQGRVVVRFRIDTLGNIDHISILQSPDRKLSDEVIRVLKTAPRWKPGQQRDKKVPVAITIPVDFKRKD